MSESQLLAALEELLKKRDEPISTQLGEHSEAILKLGHAVANLNTTIKNAFPDGDANGHRVYHEEIMQAIADRKRIRQAVLVHVLKTSTWGAIVGLGTLAFKYGIPALLNALKGVH